MSTSAAAADDAAADVPQQLEQEAETGAAPAADGEQDAASPHAAAAAAADAVPADAAAEEAPTTAAGTPPPDEVDEQDAEAAPSSITSSQHASFCDETQQAPELEQEQGPGLQETAAAAFEAAAAEQTEAGGCAAAEAAEAGAEAEAVDGGPATHRSGLTTSSAQDSEQQHGAVSAQASSTGFGSSRPASAAHNQLRGSRPCSAAIAAQIEGFEADFLGSVDAPHMLLDDVPEGARCSSTPDEAGAPTVVELLAEQQQEHAALLDVNEGLQQRARQVLEQCNKGRPPVDRGLARLDGADARYRVALKTWVELRKEREQVASHYQATIFSMKAALEGRIQRAEEVAATLAHFKHEVAAAAEDGKTGRLLPRRLLEELESKERALDEEVQRVRLKNIHLGNALKKLEATLRSKEQLAEGLHLIDFEQLKIENQSLNEKIEERNEELLTLRKKTTVAVQILTHTKAKLAFVESENAGLQEELAQLEAALAGKRDELATLKARRDRLRQQGRQLREDSVFVTSPLLLQDMRVQKDRRDELLAEVEALRLQFAKVASCVGATANTSRAASPALTTPAAGSGSAAGKLQSGGSRAGRNGKAVAAPGLHVSSAPRMR